MQLNVKKKVSELKKKVLLQLTRDYHSSQGDYHNVMPEFLCPFTTYYQLYNILYGSVNFFELYYHSLMVSIGRMEMLIVYLTIHYNT